MQINPYAPLALQPTGPTHVSERVVAKSSPMDPDPWSVDSGQWTAKTGTPLHPQATKPPSMWSHLKSQVLNLGGSIVNKPLLDHFRQSLTSPGHQNAIKASLTGMHQRRPLKEIEQQTLQAALAQHGNRLAPAQLTALTYDALMVAAINTSYTDPRFFKGQQDKLLHYLTSAAFTARAQANLPFDASDNRRISGMAVRALGWLKEAFSMPFSPEDMAANDCGIKASHEMTRKLRADQMLIRST